MDQDEVNYVNKNRDKYLIYPVYDNYDHVQVIAVPLAEYEPELIPSGNAKIMKKNFKK